MASERERLMLRRLNARSPYFPTDGAALANWMFREGRGSLLLDSAGMTQGTIYNGTWGVDQHGQYIEFNGTTTYIACGADTTFLPAAGNIWTVEMMVQPFSDTGVYLSKSLNADMATTASSFRLSSDVDTASYLSAKVRQRDEGGGAVVSGFGDVASPSGDLHHIRVTWSGTDGALYLDDMSTPLAPVTSLTNAAIQNTNSEQWHIGKDNAGNFFTGRIYAVRTSSMVRQEQIMEI